MVHVKAYVLRCGNDCFYKAGTKFKGTIRPTIIDGWREFANQRMYKRHECPKTPRREYKEDFQTFKEVWNCPVYLEATSDSYNSTAVGYMAVAYPTYCVDGNFILSTNTELRGRYLAAIFNLEKVDKFPREEGAQENSITEYVDITGTRGWNKQMFDSLGGGLVEELNEEERSDANITGAGKPIDNWYNKGYEYKDGRLSLAN